MDDRIENLKKKYQHYFVNAKDYKFYRRVAGAKKQASIVCKDDKHKTYFVQREFILSEEDQFNAFEMGIDIRVKSCCQTLQKIHGFGIDDSNKYGYIYTPFCVEGNLRTILKDRSFKDSPTDFTTILLGTSFGLDYLSTTLGIIHPHLTTEHIFMMGGRPVVTGFAFGSGEPGSDLNAFGGVMWEMAFGKNTDIPKVGDDAGMIDRAQVSKGYKDVVKKCLSENAKDLISFKEIFNKIKNGEVCFNETKERNVKSYAEKLENSIINVDDYFNIKQLKKTEQFADIDANQCDGIANCIHNKIMAMPKPSKNREIGLAQQEIRTSAFNVLRLIQRHKEYADIFKRYDFKQCIKKESIAYSIFNQPEFIANPADFYKDEDEIIGKGSYGSVIKAYDKEKNTYALKEIPMYQGQLCSREIELLAMTNHHSLIHLKGFWVSDDLKMICILTNFVDGQQLENYINSNKKCECFDTLTATQKTTIMMTLAYALSKVHELHIIHRDVKPNNVMLTSNLFPILIDFGISRLIGEEEISENKTYIGTNAYMAPELRGGEYSYQVDVYSYGLILCYMYTKKAPEADSAKRHENIKKILPCIKERGLRELISQTTSEYQDQRPDFEEIYRRFSEHEVFFDGRDEEEVERVSQLLSIDSPDISFNSGIETEGDTFSVDSFLNAESSRGGELILNITAIPDEKEKEVQEKINSILRLIISQKDKFNQEKVHAIFNFVTENYMRFHIEDDIVQLYAKNKASQEDAFKYCSTIYNTDIEFNIAFLRDKAEKSELACHHILKIADEDETEFLKIFESPKWNNTPMKTLPISFRFEFAKKIFDNIRYAKELSNKPIISNTFIDALSCGDHKLFEDILDFLKSLKKKDKELCTIIVNALNTKSFWNNLIYFIFGNSRERSSKSNTALVVILKNLTRVAPIKEFTTILDFKEIIFRENLGTATNIISLAMNFLDTPFWNHKKITEFREFLQTTKENETTSGLIQQFEEKYIKVEFESSLHAIESSEEEDELDGLIILESALNML